MWDLSWNSILSLVHALYLDPLNSGQTGWIISLVNRWRHWHVSWVSTSTMKLVSRSWSSNIVCKGLFNSKENIIRKQLLGIWFLNTGPANKMRRVGNFKCRFVSSIILWNINKWSRLNIAIKNSTLLLLLPSRMLHCSGPQAGWYSPPKTGCQFHWEMGYSIFIEASVLFQHKDEIAILLQDIFIEAVWQTEYSSCNSLYSGVQWRVFAPKGRRECSVYLIG